MTAPATITRRAFSAMLPAAALVPSGTGLAAAPRNAPTAAQVIERIHGKLRAEGIAILPEDRTSDRFIAGDPSRPVTGIATTFMSNFEVLRRAQAAGLSLVISHEPTFYHHMDRPVGMQGDPTAEMKRAFVEKHGMTIWRFHDHWHARKPEPISLAFYRKLGIVADQGLQAIVELPPTRLADLVRRIERALGTPNLRFWGDPERIVRRARWGGHLLRQMANTDSDVYLWAEPKEFNTFDYFRDAEELGLPRSIIGMTHELIEEWGMLEPCVDWLRGFVPEVPIRGLRTEELYWTV